MNAVRRVAKINLQQGLSASEPAGRPISGKFEVDDGELQLSVYTTKDGKFFEVVIDHVTGKVAKVDCRDGSPAYHLSPWAWRH